MSTKVVMALTMPNLWRTDGIKPCRLLGMTGLPWMLVDTPLTVGGEGVVGLVGQGGAVLARHQATMHGNAEY